MHLHPTTETNHSSKHPIRTYAVRIILFIILFIAVWQMYLLAVPHARISFVTYRPSGFTITSQQQVMYNSQLLPGVNNFITPEVSVRYTVRQGNLYVYQQKGVRSLSECINVSNETCTSKMTPAGQKYIFMTLVNTGEQDTSGRPYTTQSVELFKGNTRIYVSSNSSLHWSDSQWSKLIDSFEPAHFHPLPSSWQKPGP